jgi:hypothetical protein
MLFDAHNHAFRVLGGAPRRKAICWGRRLECMNLSGLLRDGSRPWPSLSTNHQLSPRIRDGLRFSADALRSSGGQIVLLTREHSPGDPRRLIGERDDRPIEASPRREPFQPLGPAIIVLGQTKHDGAGAMNHLAPEVVIGAAQGQSMPQAPVQSENDDRRQLQRRALLRSRVRRRVASRAAYRLRSSGKCREAAGRVY